MVPPIALLQPTGELKKKLEESRNENEEVVASGLAALKEWLRQQPHLPNEWGDQCLLSFLRVCGFSLEKTKRKLDIYFTVKSAFPEFFLNRDINAPEFVEILKKGFIFPFPGLTPDGRRATFIKVVDPNVDSHEIVHAFRIGTMIGDVRLMEDIVGTFGEVGVLDASILSPRLLTHVPLTTLKNYLKYMPEAYPIKIKQIHIINTSPLSEIAYNLVKPFIKEKLRKRIYMHKDINGLYEYLPKENIPTNYGGSAGSLEDCRDAWVKKLEQYTEWFKEQESVTADESLRPGKPSIDLDELFGLEGSFRELTID